MRSIADSLFEEIENTLVAEGLVAVEAAKPTCEACETCGDMSDDCRVYEGSHVQGVFCRDCWWEADMVDEFLCFHERPALRQLRLGTFHYAILVANEDPELWVIEQGSDPVQIPFFNLSDYSDEALAERVRRLLPFV